MGYKNENLKHALGIEQKSKYQCPNCNNPLSINKPMFLVTCYKCKSIIEKDEIICN